MPDATEDLKMIKTPDQRLRVFVSSTLGELADERKAAAEAIGNMRLAPVLFELGARPHPPKDLYRAYLAQSHIFIGIYWQRYGWVAPEMDISGLEDEYRLSRDMPKLIYVKRPAPDQEPRLKSLLDEIRDDDRVSYKAFSGARELKGLIQDDLALLLTESFESSGAAPVDVPAEPEALSNLPAQPTAFIGRESEVQRLRELIAQPDVRLVTITGPGGIGKTRLSLEVAEALIPRFGHGVWLVKLSTVAEPDLVVSEIGRVLRAPDRSEGLSTVGLQEHIGGRSMLLVLDNFEHVVEMAPVVGQLLSACPNLKVLVTSRALLHLSGEYEYPAPTLDTPPAGGEFTLEEVARVESVRLFEERARAANPRFELTQDNSAAVLEICRRLDGLPLALELAAARTKLLTPEAMLKRMDKSLQLLTGGSRDVPVRQRTLRAALDWDYDLLSAEEQMLFRSLAVFAGGFTFESAEAVVNGGEVWVDVFEGIDSLASKSLLRRESNSADDLRFGTLKIIREYGMERLRESGDAFDIQERHARYVLDLARRAEDTMRGSTQTEWLVKLEREHDNIRAALQWSSENAPELELELAGALGSFWANRSYLTEGRFWLELALDQARDAGPDLKSRAMCSAGILARGQGDYGRAEMLLEQSVDLRRPLGNDVVLARVLKNLGNVYVDTGDFERASKLYEESMEVARSFDDVRGSAEALNNLGVVAGLHDEWSEASNHYEESLKAFTSLGDDLGRGRVLMNLAESRLEAGDLDEAALQCKESLRLLYDIGSHWDLADVLEIYAAVAGRRADPTTSARFFGAAEALREMLKTPLPPSERERYEQRVVEVRLRLDGTAFAVAWAVGRSMTVDEVVEFALGV